MVKVEEKMRDIYFYLYGVQVIDISKDLKWNISVLMRLNRVEVQGKF